MARFRWTEDPDVRCPYYQGQAQSEVCCEGVRGNARIHMAFPGKQERRQYQQEFCCRDWCRCPVAGMHNRRWGYPGE